MQLYFALKYWEMLKYKKKELHSQRTAYALVSFYTLKDINLITLLPKEISLFLSIAPVKLNKL